MTAAKIQERIVHDLEHQPPSFVVDRTDNSTGRVADDPAYQWFHHFIEHKYSLVFADNSVRIYVFNRVQSRISG